MLNFFRNHILLFGVLFTQTFVWAQSPTANRVTENRTLQPYTNTYNAHWEARRSPGGMMLVGRADSLRVLAPFSGSATGGNWYAEAVNAYKKALGASVNVYCMVIPNSTAYYTPDAGKSMTHEQRTTVNNIYAHLRPDVQAVDVYTPLAAHVAEPIFLRTDTHWGSLAAYYAAEHFAAQAGVPFKKLDGNYTRHEVKNFVGSMRIYAKSPEVKASPETFVYYKPQGVDYEATFTKYTLKNGKTISESEPTVSDFFYTYKDGNGAAYCTFMGGDTRTVQVRTSTHNGRRLLILKDSFGNALPAFLFFSFEEIHVVDFRYFPHNIVEFARKNQITDVLFANNISHAYAPGTARTYQNMLTRK